MLRRIVLVCLFLLFASLTTNAQIVRVNGFVEKGGMSVRISPSQTINLMQTFPGATVTVYNTGTLTLSTIWQDSAGTIPKSNPFIAGLSDASYDFYVADGRYDIKFSGTGISVPFTLTDLNVAASGGGGGGAVTSVFGRTGNVVALTNDYTWAQINKATSSLADINVRSASDLSSGTLPDGRFPSVLPAISGANLTSLNASNLSTGTVPDGRFPAVLPAISGANLTNLNASNLASGTIPDARFPAILPAISGQNLTNLNASNISSGTLNDARLSNNVVLENITNTFTQDNYFTGSVGIGTITPRRSLDILSTTQAQLRLSYADNAVYVDFTTSSGGTLNIAPTGNIEFDAAGNNILPEVTFDQNLGSLNKKFLTLHAAELFVDTLVAQDTMATIGGRILVGPTTELILDLTVGATTIDVKHNNLANGDRVYLEEGGQVEFLAITSTPTTITGGFRYNVTRNLDGTGANAWNAGDAVFNTGQTGNGFIDIYSTRGVNSASEVGPTIVGNVRNSATYNDWTEHWAIGNLNGLYGYGTNTYGVALGKYDAATSHITVDATNGIRMFDGLSTVRAQIAADGSGFLASNNIVWDASGNATIAGWAINSTSIQSNVTYVASNLDAPAGAMAWFGQSATNYRGLSIRDASNRQLSVLANDGTTFPYVHVFDGTRARVVLGGLNNNWGAEGSVNSMGMKIWDSSGNLLVHFSDVANVISGWTISNTKIAGTGIDLVSGANAYLAFGTTPPTSASSGTGIFLDRTGLYGLNASVLQAKMDASNGKIIAGGGRVTLDSDRITIDAPSSEISRFRFTSGSGFTDFSYLSGSLGVAVFPASGQAGQVALTTNNNAFTSFSSFVINTNNAGSISTAEIEILDSVTNTLVNGLTLTHRASGTPAANFGTSITFNLDSASAEDREAARIGAIWTTATDASRTSAIIFQTVNNAGALTEGTRITGTGEIVTNSVQWSTGSKPSCDSTNRGKVWYVAGGAGVADTFEVCKKDAGDAYAWTSLY